VYDNVSDCARKPAVVAAAPVARLAAAEPSGESKPVTLGAVGSVAITSPTTAVDLTVPHQAMVNALAAPRAAGSMELVLHDVGADTPPGTLFNVYLAVKGDPAKRQTDRHDLVRCLQQSPCGPWRRSEADIYVQRHRRVARTG
jgi:hypothetical protein